MLHTFLQAIQLVAKPHGDIIAAEAFILLGFGLNQEDDGVIAPGASNMALAQWVASHNPYKLPTITQMGIYLALKELEKEQPDLAIDTWVINLPHDPRVHVDTAGAALQIWLICENTGISRVCLVTHPHQSERARRIFGKLPLTELIMPHLPDIPYDPASIQIWTRSRFYYLLFEYLMARPIGYLFGWL